MKKFSGLVFILLAMAFAVPDKPKDVPGEKSADFDWSSIPAGQWTAVPTTGFSAPKVFHGGAAIAPERGEVFFFGSDTHAPTELEKGESNAVWRLNLNTLVWSRDYEQDPKSAETYLILPDSQTVTASGRPWAMHTFDGVEYDPSIGRVVVVSFPGHARFEPEERYPWLKGEWYTSLKPMHWEYDPDTKQWNLLREADAPPIFAGALAYDSDRGMLVAHTGTDTYVFDRKNGKWIATGAVTQPGWHLAMVYDTYHQRPLLFGHNLNDTVVDLYDYEKGEWEAQEIDGEVLPANGSAMAFDTNNEVLIFLANDAENTYHNASGKSATFVYDPESVTWRRLAIESPPLYGMNYLTQFDPVRNVMLFFEKSPETGNRVKTWAFRYK